MFENVDTHTHTYIQHTEDRPYLYYKLTNEPKGSGELKQTETITLYIYFIKQVAQRATIAHLSPMCQGQISFQKLRTHPSFNACSCYMKVSKGSNQKQQRKGGNTIFPIISLCGYFLDAQGPLTP